MSKEVIQFMERRGLSHLYDLDIEEVEAFSNEKLQEVYKWLNQWEQLNGTSIPLRFKEKFLS